MTGNLIGASRAFGTQVKAAAQNAVNKLTQSAQNLFAKINPAQNSPAPKIPSASEMYNGATCMSAPSGQSRLSGIGQSGEDHKSKLTSITEEYSQSLAQSSDQLPKSNTLTQTETGGAANANKDIKDAGNHLQKQISRKAILQTKLSGLEASININKRLISQLKDNIETARIDDFNINTDDSGSVDTHTDKPRNTYVPNQHAGSASTVDSQSASGPSNIDDTVSVNLPGGAELSVDDNKADVVLIDPSIDHLLSDDVIEFHELKQENLETIDGLLSENSILETSKADIEQEITAINKDLNNLT